MTEASVLAPVMKQIRDELPTAVVVKHADRSMIGLVDFSVTHNTKVGWFEAKLYVLPKNAGVDRMTLAREFVLKAQKDSPTQAEMLRKFHRAALGLYVIFVKKSFVIVADPDLKRVEFFKKGSDCALFLSALMIEPESWWNRAI